MTNFLSMSAYHSETSQTCAGQILSPQSHLDISVKSSAHICAGLEFTRREIVAKIHIGEATLAKRVTEFATTAAGELTLEEFDQRGRALETEQMALLESTQPSEEEAAPGCRCIHIGAFCCALPSL